jgi:hypothetical protein
MMGPAARLATVVVLFLACATSILHAINAPLARASGTLVPRDRALWTAETYRSYKWYTYPCNAAPYYPPGSVRIA